MIYIDLFDNPPPPELIAEGEQLTRELMALPPDQRNDLSIDMATIGEN